MKQTTFASTGVDWLDPALCACKQKWASTFSHCHNASHPFHSAVVWPFCDPAMEEALHDMALFREFAQLDARATRLPDESTILRIRHLLEANNLASQILATVNA